MNLPLPPQSWDIDRLSEERAEAVSGFGFTERQSRFLVEVLTHSGVFVERQYCAFAGITHGQKTTDFLRCLVERGMPGLYKSARCIGAGCFTSTISRCTRRLASLTTGTESLWHWGGCWSV